jgi:hypothetical protein
MERQTEERMLEQKLLLETVFCALDTRRVSIIAFSYSCLLLANCYGRQIIVN